MWNLFTRFFKCRHLIWLSILCVAFAGCNDDFEDSELRDQIADLDGRLTSLEKLCAQMNTNISSMQTIVNALQQNDYITGVTPIMEGGNTIGYTITFMKNKPITIYHGKDGKKGEDGITPRFKIESGRWMVSRDNGSTWEDAGQATGDQGLPGVAGITPKLKIENGRWLISWDNGASWEDVGQATGDQGQQGAAGITPQFKIEFGNWFVSFDHGTNWSLLGQATGDKGEDGITPVIGIKQDTDGIYYWTLNGTWLLDDNNQKVKAEGTDGASGEGGTPGTPGKDGVTPLLRIENAYWEVSYDNGTTWQTLWRATGPQGEKGEQGIPGKDGDSMFSDVDYTSSNEYVVFTLSDGEQLKIPTWYAFEELRTKCNQMNTNISSLQSIVTALEKNDYVTSITPLMEEGKAIGYTISFSKSPAIVIYHGKDGQDGAPGEEGIPGQDGTTPIIGVQKDSDGIYYWTLNGDWLLDSSSNKIKAQGIDGKDGEDGTPGEDGNDGTPGASGQNGITPQLKIEEGYWYVSYEESVWQKLGPSTAGGDNAFFEDVTEDEDYVHMTLGSGTQISIPKYKPLSITFSVTNNIQVLPNKTYTITYTLNGSDLKTEIKALAQDGFRAVVKSIDHTQGVIEITTPATILNSEVLIFISDGKGYTTMRYINFVEGVMNITTKSFTVEYGGGEVTVNFQSNIDYTVKIPTEAQKWLSISASSRYTEINPYFIRFKVEPNSTTNGPRSAIVNIVDELNTIIETISIHQRGGRTLVIQIPSDKTLEQSITQDIRTIDELIIAGSLTPEDYAFIQTIPNLNSVDLSGITNTEIPERAFYRSKVTSVKMPNTIKTIGSYAFYESKITSLILPYSLERIEDHAFSSIKVKENLIIPETTIFIGESAFSSAFFGYDYNNEPKFNGTLTLGSNLKEIGARAFWGCRLLGDLIIPNSVQKLGESAFEWAMYFSGLLKIGNGLTTIPAKAFSHCHGIKDLSIGENVAGIGDEAFLGLTGCTGNLVIPDKVGTIGLRAFMNGSFTGYLHLGPNVHTIKEDAFVLTHSYNSDGITNEVKAMNFSYIEFNRIAPTDMFISKVRDGEYNSFGCAKPYNDPDNGKYSLTGTFPSVLYIPEDARPNYIMAPGWKYFTIITKTFAQ
ncbi:PL29 family lyase N-terminal domain-containing protein [Butyricimonas synergistica]|uniref:PL29 family lyase N-terminal domain-containing protein n=1 Tax=Butyricimonas synergistica TaxID=544644 RepID=UPI0022E13ECE|nr:PL29 family lyase N-terminal domain-containing protein [Butyricimonas synergistica]